MFCDLVDSTVLSTRLDPEDHREVLRAYQGVCAKVIAQREGYTAQFLGDGVLAYFGYPKAHEDDAERAALAALEIVEAVAALRLHGEQIRTRVGIATGLAVVGDKIAKGADWEVGVVGETPNLAARLQGLARPGEVVVGSRTRQLLGGQFEYEDLGEHALKGFAEPVRAWRVLSAVALGSRFKALRGFDVELVGRREEQALLKDLGARVARGEGRAALVRGEAGIGKSRLAHALAEWMGGACGARLVELQCSAHRGDSALFPAASALRQLVFGDRRRDEGPAAGERRQAVGTPWAILARFLGETLGEAAGEALPLFANLLSIPIPEDCPPSPPPERRAILRHLLDLFAGCGGGGPVLLLMEDLHWADPFTLEFAEHLVEHGGARRLLALFTSRPEFAPRWARHAHVTLLPLGRLSEADAAELVRHALGGRGLARDVIESVVAKTDGVPLYLLEYAKALAESGARDGGRVIPSTLHDLLLARLDQLGEAKAVAQTAALLGREFDGRLLEAVWEPGPQALRAGLARLWAAALVQPKGEPARRRYEFRHALIQDAAYESLLKSRRVALHRRIAEVAERGFPQIVDAEPEWLAQHFSLAGLAERAILWWERAGLKAGKLAAYAEACRHFEAAIGQVGLLPEEPARHQRELDLRIQLGMALQTAYGYSCPQLEPVYLKARELCHLLGDTAEHYPVVRGLVSYYITRCDVDTALAFSEQCAQLGEKTGRPEYQIEAYNSLGYSHAYSGRIAQAEAALLEGERLYLTCNGDALGYPSPHNPLMAFRSMLAMLGWMACKARQSLYYEQALADTLKRLESPYNDAYGSVFMAFLQHMRGRLELASVCATANIELSKRHQMFYMLQFGEANLAVAQALGGQVDAIETLKTVIDKRDANKPVMFQEYYRTQLAEAYRLSGDTAGALAAIDEAMACSYGERWFLAEHHRIRGELLAEQGQREEGEAELKQALAVACEQGAKLFELRAAQGMHRLGLGADGEARALLAEAVARIEPEDGAYIGEWQEAASYLDQAD